MLFLPWVYVYVFGVDRAARFVPGRVVFDRVEGEDFPCRVEDEDVRREEACECVLVAVRVGVLSE